MLRGGWNQPRQRRIFSLGVAVLLSASAAGFFGGSRVLAADAAVPCDIGLPGDLDNDGDVDAADFALLRDCIAKADRGGTPDPACAGADLNGDGRLDSADLEAWNRYYTGPADCGPMLKEPPNPLPESTRLRKPAGGLYAVQPFSGEFRLESQDLQIAGRGIDFAWTRTYRSRSGSNTAMGNGWDHAYNIHIEPAGPHVRVYDGRGRSDVYIRQSTDTWTRQEMFRLLSRNGDGTFTLAMADGARWNFRRMDGSAAAGRINSIVDHSGNALTFTYDGLGRLTTIHDTLDTNSHTRDIGIAYNTAGYVESVTDFAGRRVTYSYYEGGDADGSAGDLKSVTSPVVAGTPQSNDFPNGITVVYTYSRGFSDARLNHNLLTITDGKGQTWLSNTYGREADVAGGELRYDRIIRQVYGNASLAAAYRAITPTPANAFAAVRATVTDGMGDVTEYSYDGVNRPVMVREYTGRGEPGQPTDISDDLNPPRSPLRSSDPPFFETRFEYNRDSLCTRVVFPNLNSERFTYDSGNSDVRARGNLLERRRVPGPLGGHQSQIVESFEYEPRSNLLTRAVDARGEETLHTYDERGSRIRTEYPDSTVEEWEYNRFGQVTAHIVPQVGDSARRDESRYYESGPQRGYLQQQVVDAPNLALTTTYRYDNLGRLISRTGPGGGERAWFVNALGQVVRETSPEPRRGATRPQKYTSYDANGNVIRIDVLNLDESGQAGENPYITTDFTHDILNHVTSMAEEIDASRSIVTEYEYDAAGNRVLTRKGEAVAGNQPANTVTTLYDERGLLFREVFAAGDPGQSTTEYDYDNNGNLQRVERGIESEPRVTSRDYDGYNRVMATRDPMGNHVIQHYDAAGNVISRRVEGEAADVPGGAANTRLAESRYEYDAMNRQVAVSEAVFDPQANADAQAITKQAYSGPLLVRTINPNDGVVSRTYDSAGRLASISDSAGTVLYGYDAAGNRIRVSEGTRAQPRVSRFEYDGLGRIVRAVDGAGAATQYGYDSRGNKTRETDPLGNVTTFSYDGLDRLLRTARKMSAAADTSQEDIVVSQAWDDSSRVIARTDPNGNTTTYVYDALDRLLSTHYADGSADSAAYDVHGNALRRTDALGTVVSSTFDLLDRTVERNVTRANGIVGTTREIFTWDGLSRIAAARNDESAVARRYDSLGRLLSESQQIVPAGPARLVQSAYDLAGNRTQLAYPGGRTIAIAYDAANRPVSLDIANVADESVAKYSYSGRELVEAIDFGSGVRETISRDRAGRITETRFARGDDVLDDRTYAWDSADNKTQMQAAQATTPDGRSYQYDRAKRLVATHDLAGKSSIDYVLDPAGNRTAVSAGVGAGQYTMDPTLPSPADRQMDRYTGLLVAPASSRPSTGNTGETPVSQAFTYDRAGNLRSTHNGRRLCSYDYANRLCEVSDLQAGLVIMYKYDAFGRRIERNAGGAITRYYYDGDAVIEEQNQSNISAATYIYGPPLGGASRQPLPLQMHRSGHRHFYVTDDQGSPRLLTNSSGEVIEAYQYSDYGRPTFVDAKGQKTAVAPSGNPVLFLAMRYDPETSFYLEASRYLDPLTGRYTTRPAGGLWARPADRGNPYTFAGNNPGRSR
jgi:YD repeat-containing protein